MHRLPISLLILCVFWTVSGLGDFSLGLEAFKKNDLSQSRENFAKLLNENPQDPTLLYNLGLVELNDKHPGRALAYWRKALYLDPGFAPALSGLSHLKKAKLLTGSEEALWMWLYWRVPLSALLAAALLFFLLSGYLLIRYAAHKKMNKPAGALSWVCSLGACTLLLGLSLHNFFILHTQTQATVMEASVPVYSSPSPEAPSLFEFKEGDAVSVRRTQGDWLQVQKSATSVGWIKKNQILIHSGI